MESLENKVAVITGAANGIGEAIARQCVKRKMKVVLADIDTNRLIKLEKELKNESHDIVSVITDVSIKSDIINLAKVTISSFGKVHLLFNNAGIAGPLGAIWEVDEDKLQKTININLMSVIYGLREFIPIMLSQNEECYIVNTASGAGLHTSANMSCYIATKHAVVALSEVLFFDLEKRQSNIHVSVLCPGLVSTSLVESIEVKKESTKDVNELAEFFKKSIKTGMSPSIVAEQVFASIHKNQFYILTHYNEHKELIKSRMENILQRHNPVKPAV
jgi:short-subunit dehydrogenase